MTNESLANKIKRLKKERNAIILAHYYQNDEVQAVADYTGDSLGLSRKAANAKEDVIVFCGVDFMAESAAILSPQKTVLLPERNAGCPMADMVDVEGLRELKKKHPKAKVVCYVNSSAAVKAESDICCTSSNAVDIVNNIEAEQIIFTPDQNLGDYVSKRTDKEVILWEGFCITHHRVRAADIEKVSKIHTNTPIVVHPECRPEVVEKADFVGSTAQILEFARNSKDEKLIIGTEMGILYKLKEESPPKTFYLLSQGLICQNMKMTSLEDVASALEEMKYQISVEEEVRVKAKKALGRMLELNN
ncbi:quinolinate synthase NadA [Halonatronum saccharophilum]|uniref:quinolinate synthase NadA n=1 Tax=Halonatronum saccharophilum TaxID=150060 RepID=UPI000483F9F5|nr:quinolinate synthase NadA [Halonatronum saccharophilum]